MEVLKAAFPDANILLSSFHVIKWLKTYIGKVHITVDVKNMIMTEIMAMVWANSESIYTTSYDKLHEILLEYDEETLNYFNNNWHNCQEDRVFYFRLTLPTFGTNTNNHLESISNH